MNNAKNLRQYTKHLNVLYVEDDDQLRESTLFLLEPFFKEIDSACNGKEGLDLYNKKQYDIVITDISMPKMNGIEMLENIRSLDTDVPIIYTTARTESEHLLKAIELNVNHYVLKPIDSEDVINRIQIVCEKKYYQRLIKSKNNELEQYLGIIDNVAIIMKMNEKKEITFAKDCNVPVFGVYVGGAGTSSNLPDGLQRNRTSGWDWDKIASTIDQMMKEGKNK